MFAKNLKLLKFSVFTVCFLKNEIHVYIYVHTYIITDRYTYNGCSKEITSMCYHTARFPVAHQI